MNIFTAPQWDVDEQSDKLANVLGGSAPSSNKKKAKTQKNKKAKNVLKPVPQQTPPIDGAETKSKTPQASGPMKKMRLKTGSGFKIMQDQALSGGQIMSKSAQRKLKKKQNIKSKMQHILNPSENNPEVKSILTKTSSGDGKPVLAGPSKKAKRNKKQKIVVENKGNLADSQSRMERLFEVKKKQRRSKKAVAAQGYGPLLPFLHSKSPAQSENDNNMQRKLKRKAKKEKKKEALVNSNEVVLNKSKQKKMHKIAKKVSKGKLLYLKNHKDEQGTTNPSFDTSLTESVSDNYQQENSKKKSKKKKKGLSDTVDGNFMSTAKKFKLDSNNKEVVSRITEPDTVPDKPQKKKLPISKLLEKADIFEKTTLHDLKRKRRSEMEDMRNNSESARKKLCQFSTPLRQKMAEQLKSARFRWLNEQLYTSKSWEALKYFKEDQDAFEAYHSGYRNQVAQWPVNPVNVITKYISSMPNGTVVADFGCGEAHLAESLPKYKVHSLDLVALKPGVIACDMAHTPLLLESVDVAVFCLSLMGTNLNDFILEANRVLKNGGLLMIAEVESRFEDVDNFTSAMVHFGFNLKKKDLDTQMFIFMDFKKVRRVAKAGKLPALSLEPCVYKKR